MSPQRLNEVIVSSGGKLRAATPVTSSGGRLVRVASARDLLASSPGSEVAAPAPSGTATSGLTFEVPADLRYQNKKIISHWFPTFPVSVDDDAYPSSTPAQSTGEYWYDNWEHAAVENGTSHRAYGGYVRDRPFPRAVRGGSEPTWRQADAAVDIAQAKAMGVWAFFPDVLSSDTNDQWNQWTWPLLDAADADGNFKVCPQLDLTSGFASASNAVAADFIAEYAYVNPVRGQTTGNTWRNCAWLRNGAMVVAAYRAEAWSVSKWQAVFAELQAQYGIQVAFFPTFSNFNNYYQAYAAITDASSIWGDGAQKTIPPATTNRASQAHSVNTEHYQEIWFSDHRESYHVGQVRPGRCDESSNLETLWAYWLRAINQGPADHVIYNTWSDYREGGMFRPGPLHGYCPGDFGLYFAIRWMYGQYPAILRDGVILTHRNQHYSGTTGSTVPVGSFRSGVQTVKGYLWGTDATASESPRPNGVSPYVFEDKIRTYSFLTAPATIRVTVNGTSTDFSAPAGLSMQELDLDYGQVSAEIIRGGSTVESVVSPHIVKGGGGFPMPYKDNAGYCMVSSVDGHQPAQIGQYDWDGSL